MTVQQAIEQLKKLTDKKMEILLDCPHCGESQQLAAFEEVVIMRGKQKVEVPE